MSIQLELIRYFEELRDRCKQPENKAEIQKEIDRLKAKYENNKG